MPPRNSRDWFRSPPPLPSADEAFALRRFSSPDRRSLVRLSSASIMTLVAAAADAEGTRSLMGGSRRVSVWSARGHRRLKSGPMDGDSDGSPPAAHPSSSSSTPFGRFASGSTAPPTSAAPLFADSPPPPPPPTLTSLARLSSMPTYCSPFCRNMTSAPGGTLAEFLGRILPTPDSCEKENAEWTNPHSWR